MERASVMRAAERMAKIVCAQGTASHGRLTYKHASDAVVREHPALAVQMPKTGAPLPLGQREAPRV